MADDGYQVDPEQLRTTAGRLGTDVLPEVNRANQHLQGAPRAVAFPAFSTIGFALAAAYVESLNFVLADMDTKQTNLDDYERTLRTDAANYRAADDASTVQEG